MDDAFVTSIEASGREQLRVELTAFRGRQRLDLRIWTERRDGSLVPTRKGISFSANLLPQVIKALKEAHLGSDDRTMGDKRSETP